MVSKKIVCPSCHGTLEVTNPRQEPELMIKCPNPACGAKLRVRFDTGETVLAAKKGAATVPGYLTWGGQAYELKEGRNTVGRSSSKHEADIEIPTDDHSVSRMHCLLEAIRLSDCNSDKTGRVKVIISDLRSSDKIVQKPTLVYEEPLAAEDRLVLDDGDSIEIGNQVLRFHQKTLES